MVRGAGSSSDSGSVGEEVASGVRGTPAWRHRRALVLGLRYGAAAGSVLALAILTVWLHLCLRVELDMVRRQVTRGQQPPTSISLILYLYTIVNSANRRRGGGGGLSLSATHVGPDIFTKFLRIAMVNVFFD